MKPHKPGITGREEHQASESEEEANYPSRGDMSKKHGASFPTFRLKVCCEAYFAQVEIAQHSYVVDPLEIVQLLLCDLAERIMILSIDASCSSREPPTHNCILKQTIGVATKKNRASTWPGRFARQHESGDGMVARNNTLEGQEAAPIPTDQQPPASGSPFRGMREAAGGWLMRERLGPTPSCARRR